MKNVLLVLLAAIVALAYFVVAPLVHLRAHPQSPIKALEWQTPLQLSYRLPALSQQQTMWLTFLVGFVAAIVVVLLLWAIAQMVRRNRSGRPAEQGEPTGQMGAVDPGQQS